VLQLAGSLAELRALSGKMPVLGTSVVFARRSTSLGHET
jgi:hypothetical protein